MELKDITLLAPTTDRHNQERANCLLEEAKTLIAESYLSSINGISETELKGEAKASRA